MSRPKIYINRKTEILDAAQILFASKGFEKTTIQEIADYIEIGKGSIYLDFKNKDEIYLAIVERYVTALTEKFENRIKNAKAPYLDIIETTLINHPLEIYDMAVFHMQPHAALIHTSYKIKQKLRYLIQKWYGLMAFIMNKAAKNDEIINYENFEDLAHLIHIALQGFFPPYDIKYSPDYRNDLTKEEIRILLHKDISLVVKILLSGLKTVKYDNDLEQGVK